MVVHELATNAVKYGGLSRPGGTVSVWWGVEDERLDLTWIEHGGPPVSPPTRRGFGSRLIERSLDAQAGGSAGLEFAPAGVICRVSLPLGR
jgi:two-component sensor histidine kinase